MTFFNRSLFCVFVVKDTDIASYADDSTTFIVENYIDSVLTSLEQTSDVLFNCLKNNGLKSNGNNCLRTNP